MAAVLSEEQVLEIILNDNEDHETDESCEPDNDQIIRGKLVDLIEFFFFFFFFFKFFFH